MKLRHNSQKYKFVEGVAICFPASSLNQPNEIKTINTAKRKAHKTTKNDSLKNCRTNCPRDDPKTLRIPTSFILFSDLAVLKFMKLIQANTSTKTPIIPYSQTN